MANGAQFSTGDSPVTRNTGFDLVAVPDATVTVCTQAGTGIPCTPLAVIWQDLAMSIPQANPLTSDVNGNYGFVAAGGLTYFITVQGNGVVPYTFYWTAPGVTSAGNVSFSNVTSGTAVGETLTVGSGSVLVPGAGGQSVANTISSSTASALQLLSPSQFPNFTFIVTDSATPGDCSVGGGTLKTLCQSNGTSWVNVSGGSSGGGLTSPVNSPSPFVFNTDMEFKGPSPYIDIRAYGARAINVNLGIPTVTATCTGTGCVFSSASSFQNGDGVCIFGAGAVNTMATPAAPTVTTSLAGAMSGTGYVVAGPTGNSTSYSYKIAVRDIGGGVTAASPLATITNGAATLGAQNVSMTSCTRNTSTQVVSCTTSFAHGLAPGATIDIAGTSNDFEFGGWQTVTTTPSNTTFTYTNGISTVNGGGASCTGGTVYWWNCNHLVLPAPPAGAFQYLIYLVSGAISTLIGMSGPINSTLAGDPSYLTFDDFGQPMTGIPVSPVYIPTSAPTVATNDNFVTTIASGGGTTAITLASPVTTPVTNATTMFDNVPAIGAAAAAANLVGSLYIPPTAQNFYWVTSSYLNLPEVGVLQAGAMFLGDTMQFNQGTWKGQIPIAQSNTSVPQFGIEPHVAIFAEKGNPGIYIPTGSASFRDVNIVCFGGSYSGMYVLPPQFSPAIILENVGFVANPPTNDFNGIFFTAFAGPSTQDAGFYFRNVTFTDGPGQVIGASATPSCVFKNVSEISFDGAFMNRRGIFLKPDSAGMQMDFNQRYEEQGGITPAITVYGGGSNAAGWIRVQNLVLDTMAQPAVTNLGSNSIAVSIEGSTPPGCCAGLLSGNAFLQVQLSDYSGLLSQIGQNVDIRSAVVGLAADGLLSSSSGNQGLIIQNQHMGMGAGNSLFTGSATPAPPTCSVATAGPPFSPAGTFTYKYAATFPPNNGYGPMSGYSSSCTSDGLTQQITVTIPAAIPGATGYIIFRCCDSQMTCSAPSTTTLSYLVTNVACGQSSTNMPAAGPAGLLGQDVWAKLHLATPGTFASLPSCSAATTGYMGAVSDSNTQVWGATVAGGSSNFVLAICDGTNWTVVGK